MLRELSVSLIAFGRISAIFFKTFGFKMIARKTVRRLPVCSSVTKTDKLKSVLSPELHKTFTIQADSGPREELPRYLVEALSQILTAISTGGHFALVEEGGVLSTTQAAKLLGISRPHLGTLLDAEKIPSFRIGSHRRVKAADALSYLEQKAAKLKSLDDFTDAVRKAGVADIYPVV